jgi:hypothetical protein
MAMAMQSNTAFFCDKNKVPHFTLQLHISAGNKKL